MLHQFFFSLRFSPEKEYKHNLKYKLGWIFIFIHTFIDIFSQTYSHHLQKNMNSWTNGYYSFPNATQRDAQPLNWFNQNLTSGFNSKFTIVHQEINLLNFQDRNSVYDFHDRSHWSNWVFDYFSLDPSALRFNNYFSGASNPFAGQMFTSPYQANSGFGDGFNYQYRGW